MKAIPAKKWAKEEYMKLKPSTRKNDSGCFCGNKDRRKSSNVIHAKYLVVKSSENSQVTGYRLCTVHIDHCSFGVKKQPWFDTNVLNGFRSALIVVSHVLKTLHMGYVLIQSSFVRMTAILKIPVAMHYMNYLNSVYIATHCVFPDSCVNSSYLWA